jgi:uncharacterized integral membrane protein
MTEIIFFDYPSLIDKYDRQPAGSNFLFTGLIYVINLLVFAKNNSRGTEFAYFPKTYRLIGIFY